MKSATDFIKFKLQQRAENGLIRKLSSAHSLIDFCSNDYLGFARSAALKQAIENTSDDLSTIGNGSGGSRLLSGNHPYTEETEAYIAGFHNAPAGLIYNSGYDANVGLLSSLAQKGDTFICDELIHASLIDGARLTHANRYTFRHNDLNQLEEKLKISKGTVYVVVESVYSMDGDTAPLQGIVTICESYGANLIVDEAHATGVFGDHGKGLVQALNLEQQVFARIVTFGKAVGCHGAIVLGNQYLRQYLINFSRAFIYTTAAPLHNIISVRCAYEQLMTTDHTLCLHAKIALYRQHMEHRKSNGTVNSTSAIQTLIIPGNAQAKAAAASLQDMGFDVRAILSPTIPEGKERLRICVHTYNTDSEIEQLAASLKELY